MKPPLPTKFYPPFLPKPRTIIPTAVRNWIGSLLQGPARGPRHGSKQACVLALGRIGDFVLSLPAFRLFAREFGPDQLTLVLPPSLVSLAAHELPGVELVTLTPEAGSIFREMIPIWWHQRPKLAAHSFERRITLNHYRPFYHQIALSWIDARQDFNLMPETYPAALRDGQCTELQAHQLVASAALGRPVAWEEIVPSFTRFPASDDGRMLIYPLSHDGARNISAERVIAILKLWRGCSQAPVVLGGSPGNLDTLGKYATACRAAGMSGITVEAPAGVVAFIEHLAAAGAVLAADSAAGHVGGAFDKPTVVLMPGEWYGLSQPWRKSTRQHAFVLETPDAEIAAALPGL